MLHTKVSFLVSTLMSHMKMSNVHFRNTFLEFRPGIASTFQNFDLGIASTDHKWQFLYLYRSVNSNVYENDFQNTPKCLRDRAIF